MWQISFENGEVCTWSTAKCHTFFGDSFCEYAFGYLPHVSVAPLDSDAEAALRSMDPGE